jgi:lysophospholipase L1-like esterase
VVATLLVQALGLGAWIVLDGRRSAEPQIGGASSGGTAQSAALRDIEWVPDAMQEIGEATNGIVYTSFTGLSLRDYRGRYVNVENRVRASYESPLAESGDPLDIWFFGGSTMFGYDLQRDEHTIPSEVVRLAEDAGIAVRARNYGAPGYVNFQETVLLSLLVSAEDPPDLVVFYDGINDVSVQLLAAFAAFGPRGEPSDLGAEQQRQALAAQLAAHGASDDPPSPLVERPSDDGPLTVDSLVHDIVDVYGQGIGVSEALADQYGFEVAHFWQPDIYSKAPLHPGEQELLEPLGLDPFRYDAMTGLSARIRTALPPGVLDIADALDEVPGPVLADQVHVNEAGGRAVAQAMFDDLLPTLRRLQLPLQ